MQWLFGIRAFALLIMLNSTDHFPNEHLIHVIRPVEVAARTGVWKHKGKQM